MKESADFTRLFKMHQGIFYTRLLHQAIDLKIFDSLNQKQTAEELAQHLSLHPESTLHFLRGLVAIGLLEVDGECFRNADISRRFLVSGSPDYLGAYLSSHAKWNFPLFENLDTLLKEGPTQPEQSAEDEEIWAREARTIAGFQRTCTGPALAKIVQEIQGFQSCRKMLDIGGGPGLNAVAVLRENSAMTGTVFDRKAVVCVAREYIRQEKMEQRLDVTAGDFTQDDLGCGWDFVMATACLNFVRDDLPGFISKIYQALAPDGIFVSIHEGMTHNRTSPASFALSWLPVSIMWQELALDRGQIADAMAEAGFKTIYSRPISYGLGTMELDIARK